MAAKILIVHGYSDGSTSFTGLGEFLIAERLYQRENVFHLDYSSMDDQATFRDFADKLDADHRTRLGDERVDVACHSTGSLVVRADVILNRMQTDNLLVIKDAELEIVSLAGARPAAERTGRATLVPRQGG